MKQRKPLKKITKRTNSCHIYGKTFFQGEECLPLIEQSMDGIFLIDAKGCFLAANAKFRKILGYTQRQLLKASILDTYIQTEQKLGQNRLQKIKKQKILRHERLMRKKNGSTFYAEIYVVKLKNGNIRGMIRDITHRKLAEKSIFEEKEKTKKYLDIASVMLLVLDRNGIVKLINKKGCQLLGYSEKEILNKNWFDHFIPSKENLRVKSVFKQILADQGKSLEYFENPILTKNGRIRMIAWHNAFLKDKNNRVIGAISSGEDITDHKRIEENLKESEERLRTIFEKTNDAILMVELNTRKYTFSNEKAVEMFGYTQDEIQHLTLDALHPKKDIPHVLDQYEKIIKGELTLAKEIPVMRKDGTVFYADINGFPVTFSGKKYAVGFFRDVTERISSEKKNLFLASIVQSSQDAIIGKDLNNIITSWNKGAEIIYGYRESEVVGKPITILSPPERKNEMLEFLEKIKIDQKVYHYQTIRRKKDGNLIHVSLTVSPIKDTNGQLIGISTIARDITDRKLAENILRQSEERFMKAFQTSPVLMSITTIEEGRFIEVNRAFLKTLNYDRREVIGKTVFELNIYPDPSQRVAFIEKVKAQGSVRDFEVTVRTRSGELRDGLFSAEIIELSNKEYLLTVMNDVTDVKKTQKALQESEERFRGIATNLPGVVYQFYVRPNGDMGLNFVSDRASEIAGIENKLDGFFERFASHIIPEDQQKFIQSIQEAARNKTQWNFEGRYIKPNGEKIYLRGISQPRQLKEELVFDGVMLDITDRKRAEDELLKEKNFSEAVIDAIPGTFWVVDKDAKFIKWNKHHEEVFGAPSEGFQQQYQNGYLFIHEDDREFGKSKIKEVFTLGSSAAEFRVLTKDGIRNYILHGRRLEIDNKLFLVGIGTDITEKKKIDEAITENANRLFTIIQHIEEGITFSDKQGFFEIFNNKMEELTGYTKEEANSHGDFISLIYKDPAERLKAMRGIDDVCKVGSVNEIETVIQTKKGVEKTLLVSTSVVRYKNKEMFLSVYRDISAQKRMEKIKGEFISVVSHELRTPLSIIKEGIYLVLDKSLGDINAEQEESLKTAQNNITRLSHIIDNLLNIAKIEARKEEIVKKPFDIAQLIKQITSDFRYVVSAKKLNLDVDVPQEHLVINADIDRITEVLINLIGNAIKFTETGTITITLNEKMRDIECSVSDTGIGIAKENISKVFDKFQQFGRQWGPGEKGTGLGLAIVKGIIELHGGKVSVESQIHRGTKITFELPKNLEEIKAV